jgi:hypothetical protein
MGWLPKVDESRATFCLTADDRPVRLTESQEDKETKQMSIELMQQISNILTTTILFYATLIGMCSLIIVHEVRKFINGLPTPRQIS